MIKDQVEIDKYYYHIDIDINVINIIIIFIRFQLKFCHNHEDYHSNYLLFFWLSLNSINQIL